MEFAPTNSVEGRVWAALPAPVSRYPNFDLLRLLLALEVAYVHAEATVDPSFDWPGMVMAVPAFLAISGCLVLKSYAETLSWTRFFKKRVLRIFPGLLVAFLLGYILLGWPMVRNSFVNWITGGLGHWEAPVNWPLWSLAWEELAYLVLAVLWILGAYKKPRWIWLLFGLSLAVASAGADLPSNRLIILFLPPAFFIGNLLYLYRALFMKVHAVVPWLFFLCVLATNLVPHSILLPALLLLVLQAIAVVWVGMAGLKILPDRIPDLSYGIYIYHVPFILFIEDTFHVNKAQMLLSLALVLPLFCLGSWYFIEKPALTLKRRLGPRAAMTAPRDFGGTVDPSPSV